MKIRLSAGASSGGGIVHSGFEPERLRKGAD
jgi:hypothetical protein